MHTDDLGGELEEVPARTDGADGQTERGDPAPHPQHVHIERVPTGRASWPTSSRRLFPPDDRAHPLEEHTHQPGFDRRQRHPPVTEAEHPVSIEGGRVVAVRSTPADERVDSRSKILRLCGNPDPVLQAVGHLRWRDTVLDEQQAKATLAAETLPLLALHRPAHEDHVHGPERTARTFLHCFAPMNGREVLRGGAGRTTDHTLQLRPKLPCMARASYLDHLARIPLFSSFSKRDLQKIAKASDEVTVDAGRVLVEEGTTGREAFVIIDGQATVKRNGRKVATLGPGNHFGELALLDGGPRSATVVADTPMTLLVLGQREFNGVLDEVPGLAHKLMASMAQTIRSLDRQAYG